MSLTRFLFRAARLSADARAIRRGPNAVAKRVVRKAIGRSIARTGIFRIPR